VGTTDLDSVFILDVQQDAPELHCGEISTIVRCTHPSKTAKGGAASNVRISRQLSVISQFTTLTTDDCRLKTDN